MSLRFTAVAVAGFALATLAPAGAEPTSFTQLYPFVRHQQSQIVVPREHVLSRQDMPVLGRNDAVLPDGSVAHIMPFVTPGAPAPQDAIRDDFSLMTYHGGPIEKSPKQVLVLWGFGTCGSSGCSNDPQGTVGILYNFLKGVGGTHYLKSTTQYYSNRQGHITNPRNTLAAFLVDNNNAPQHPTTQQIAHQAALVQAYLKKSNDPNTNYVIALGYGHDPVGFGPGGYCAFHSYFGNSSSFQPFTNEPYVTEAGTGCGGNSVNGPLDGVSIVLGHEVGETITDPGISAWYDGSRGENGDKCANLGLNQNVQLFTGVFPVQPLFSNAIRNCTV